MLVPKCFAPRKSRALAGVVGRTALIVAVFAVLWLIVAGLLWRLGFRRVARSARKQLSFRTHQRLVTVRTRFTELVGCRVPIQLAGMGAAATPELAAAVSDAGALGMLGSARPGLSPATLTSMLDEIRSRTASPF